MCEGFEFESKDEFAMLMRDPQTEGRFARVMRDPRNSSGRISKEMAGLTEFVKKTAETLLGQS
jgi:hypothetical protein